MSRRADNWIEGQRIELKEKYEKCKEGNEPILKAFSLYLLRILNGLAQMEGSKTYSYESQILGKAMRLFCIYYKEQVDKALEQQTDVLVKNGIIEDLEDAISKISNVYKNVIDSTSNSDRQLFTSHAVETSIYDISPKLFATYSMVLETLVTLFSQQEYYAFLLHPSLKSNVETVNLFDIRQITGKVVLIYIPENKIERVRQIPFFLLHEAFHVLTREERCRKERACKMESHMYNGIFQRLFRNVSFDFIGGNVDLDIKNELMQRWFKTEEWIAELRSLEDGDREFYSRNVITRICANWRNALRNIFTNLGEDLCQVLAEKNCQEQENPYKALMQAEWEIQRNLIEILADNKVEQYAQTYMQIYREAYADIASILTSGISPDIYERAFQESQAECENNVYEEDALRKIRSYVVAETVIYCEGIAYAVEWLDYRNEHNIERDDGRADWGRLTYGKEAPGRAQDCDDKFWIQETDLILFKEILGESGRLLWEKLGRKDSFGEFRRILGNMDMINILSGKVNQELMELKNSAEIEHKKI